MRRRIGRATQPRLNDEIRRLQKILAVLIACRVATDEDTDFDVGDALSVIVALLSDALAGLDRLEVVEGNGNGD